MKKYLALLLAFCMIFCFAACGNSEQEAADSTAAEVLENPTIELGDNLPTLYLTGSYTEDTLTDEDTALGMYASYYTTGDEPDVDLFRFPLDSANGKTLEYYVKNTVETDYAGQESTYKQYTSRWDENDETEYTYYYCVGYDEYEDVPYVIQTFWFEDGDEGVAVDYWFRLEAFDLADTDVTFMLPAFYDLNNEFEDENLAGSYLPNDTDPYEECPGMYLYAWEAEDTDIDQIEQWFKDEYDVTYAEAYDYTNRAGVEKQNLYLEFNEEIDGETVKNISVITSYEGKYYEFDFLVYDDYQELAVPALIYALDAE